MRQYYPPMPNDGEQGRRPERPDYKVYRSRPGLFSRLRSPDLSKLRAKKEGKGGGGDSVAGRPQRGKPPRSGERPLWRRVLRWVGIAALAWLLISFAGLRDLLADPEGEAGRHGRTPCTATRSWRSARRRSS